MPSPPTLVESYKGWDAFQELLVRAVAPLSDDELRASAAPHLRPVWLLAAHIIGARGAWWHEFLGEGGAWDRNVDKWDLPGMPFRPAAELVDGLQRSWALIDDCLHRWTPEMLSVEFTREMGGRSFTLSRQAVTWYVLQHDIAHGGELFLTLGMHGIAVPQL